MKKRIFGVTFLFLLISNLTSFAQTSWLEAQEKKEAQLNVLYFEYQPFIYKENEKLKGLEVEILEAFVDWLKKDKGVNLSLNYKAYKDFQAVSDRIKVAVDNSIALAAFPTSYAQKREIEYSSPYLKNISVLVTSGHLKTAQEKANLRSILSSYYATTIRGSSHEQNLKNLRYEQDLNNGEILFVGSPKAVVHAIAENGRYYGYTDLITYWQYINQHDNYLKIQKVANVDDEYFAYAFPLRSDWIDIFNEFMDSGFGFTASKKYHDILEKYLGYEIIDHVAID